MLEFLGQLVVSQQAQAVLERGSRIPHGKQHLGVVLGDPPQKKQKTKTMFGFPSTTTEMGGPQNMTHPYLGIRKLDGTWVFGQVIKLAIWG